MEKNKTPWETMTTLWILRELPAFHFSDKE